MSQVRLVGKNSLIGSPVLYSEVLVNADNKLEVSSSPNIVILPAYEATLANGEDTTPFDLRGARKVRIYGNSGTANFLQVQYAISNSPYDWKYIDQINPLTINGSICINYHLDTPPPFLRIANTSGVSHSLSLRIILEK